MEDVCASATVGGVSRCVRRDFTGVEDGRICHGRGNESGGAQPRDVSSLLEGTATAHEYMRNALRSTKIEEAFVVKEKLRAPTDVQGPAIPPTEPRLLSAPSNFTFPVQTVEFEGRSGQRAPRGGGCCWRYYPSAHKWERALRYVWPQDAILDIWVVQAPLRSLVISSRVERRRYGIEGVKACQEIWWGAESGSLRLAPSTPLLCKESARRLRAIKVSFHELHTSKKVCCVFDHTKEYVCESNATKNIFCESFRWTVSWAHANILPGCNRQVQQQCKLSYIVVFLQENVPYFDPRSLLHI
ncbi:unnamed protein product [Pylaiella littoralis]